MVFLVLAWAYLVNYAFRVVNAVIAPELARELDLTQAQLGLLSSAYFIAYALMQLPLGVMLDRYGTRVVQAWLLLIMAAGSLLFGLATDFKLLWLGRALIGLGGAGALMAAYKVFNERFPPQRMPQLSAWMLMAGGSGALLVTVPVGYFLPLTGWRGVFVALALLSVSAALITARSAPPAVHLDRPPGGLSLRAQWPAYRSMLASPALWRVAPVSFFFSGAFMASQSLWAGPWLAQVGQLDATGVAHVLMWSVIAMVAGHFIFSVVVVRLQERGVSMVRMQVHGTFWTMLAFIWIASGAVPGWVGLPWVFLGASICTNNLAFAIITRSFPPALSGRVSTALNLVIFVGAFALQWGIGGVIDWARASGLSFADAIRVAYAGVCVAQVLAFVWLVYATRRWPPPPETEVGRLRSRGNESDEAPAATIRG